MMTMAGSPTAPAAQHRAKPEDAALHITVSENGAEDDQEEARNIDFRVVPAAVSIAVPLPPLLFLRHARQAA